VLGEITHVLQDQPGLRRRWFQDDYFDLFVWMTPHGALSAFQLAYERARRERVLEWSSERGFSHSRVDSGERLPNSNRTPLLFSGGGCPVRFVAREFERRSAQLELELREPIAAKLRYARRLRRLYGTRAERAHHYAY
jgi:hypothetical protein